MPGQGNHAYNEYRDLFSRLLTHTFIHTMFAEHLL